MQRPTSRSRFGIFLAALILASTLPSFARASAQLRPSQSFPPQVRAAAPLADTEETTETIVMFRHGEEPTADLGQLTCEGLNRAMALPNVLLPRFGEPDFLFAPDPADQLDHGGLYSYVRPLATIEPTAIRAGRPVNTQLGFRQIAQLQNLLIQPVYAKSLIFVAWEHGYLQAFARQFLKSYGENPEIVPEWPENDYDTIYVFQLTRVNGEPRLSFRLEQERLNGTLPDTCPGQKSGN